MSKQVKEKGMRAIFAEADPVLFAALEAERAESAWGQHSAGDWLDSALRRLEISEDLNKCLKAENAALKAKVELLKKRPFAWS